MARPRRKFLFCEGAEDKALVLALVKAGRIDFDPADVCAFGDGVIDAPDGDPLRSRGITSLGHHLSGLPLKLRGAKRVGILADNDVEPSKGGPLLRYVQEQIRVANDQPDWGRRLSTPTGLNAVATNAPVAVSLISYLGDHDSCLETLLLKALRNRYPDKMDCVDSLTECAQIADWSQSKRDKAKVRAAIAILNKDRPGVPLAELWKDAPGIIPATDATFDDLVTSISRV